MHICARRRVPPHPVQYSSNLSYSKQFLLSDVAAALSIRKQFPNDRHDNVSGFYVLPFLLSNRSDIATAVGLRFTLFSGFDPRRPPARNSTTVVARTTAPDDDGIGSPVKSLAMGGVQEDKEKKRTRGREGHACLL